MKRLLSFLFVSVWASFASAADNSFSDLVGPVTVGEVATATPQELPYITWGADAGVFLANGLSVQTTPESIYGKSGLNYKLVNGDNFVQQCRDYLAGKRPLIRGTIGQLGLASELLSKDPRTKPVVIVQLSYSLGDHVVARSNIKNLDDLKAKIKAGEEIVVCLQRAGPHVKLVDDTLKLIQASWSDIKVIWVDDLTGDKGPITAFQQNAEIDICCVITPDMITLTGGLEATGGDAEGNVNGAHVVNSTFNMSRSIADVWAVRKDYYDTHKDEIKKFVAGYLAACETIVAERGQFTATANLTDNYKKILEFTKETIGAPIWSLEVDTHGLLTDASFVGVAGNDAFFNDAGNLEGFNGQQKAVLDLATSQGYAASRLGFFPSDLDFKEIATIAGIKYEPNKTTVVKAESTDVFLDDIKLDENTLVSFTISFQKDQTDFSVDTYGSEFKRAIEQISKFGKNRAVIMVRGHSDTTATLVEFIKAGLMTPENQVGHIQRTGTTGNYKYFITTESGAKPLDLTATKDVAAIIASGVYESFGQGPKARADAALNLSKDRADAVKAAVGEFAKNQKINLDLSQIQAVGVGITEPVVPTPKNAQEASANMRVEFRLVRISAESVKQSDFDY